MTKMTAIRMKMTISYLTRGSSEKVKRSLWIETPPFRMIIKFDFFNNRLQLI